MKSSTRRLLSFVGAMLLLLGALLVFLNFLRPAYDRAQILKGEKISLENALANQEATIAQVRRIIEEYQGSQNPKDVVSLALPQTKNESELLRHIGVLAEKYGLSMQSVTVNTPGARTVARARGAATSTASGGSLVKPIGVLTVQMRLAGSYMAFKSFLSAIETNLRIMDAGGVAVQPLGRPNQDAYTFDLTVQSYYQGQ